LVCGKRRLAGATGAGGPGSPIVAHERVILVAGDEADDRVNVGHLNDIA
jgi:hypothetical protein